MGQWKIIVQYKGKLFKKYLENKTNVRTTILIRDNNEPSSSHDFVCYLNNGELFIPNTCIKPKNNTPYINLHVRDREFKIPLYALSKYENVIPEGLVVELALNLEFVAEQA
jgi:hypothetical protein